VEQRYGVTGALDHANAFVAQDAARSARRDITLENVKIRAADCGLRNSHNSVRWRTDFRDWTLL
jgi:hypothetical protein